MQNLWSDADAEAAVAHYGAQGIGAELAERVYTTRLLGGEPRLVLHGGGNTSLKTKVTDLYGESIEVLHVKGSGWDMGAIEPRGLPAVRLEPLRRLRSLDALTDEDMVNVPRGNLIDGTSPNPSVEILLHAFLPHKFIDHTHANAVLALTDQPEGGALCAEVFGTRAAVVPYLMPGFGLAKAAADIHAANPDCEGLILLKHGIFTFGATAREAYERMISLVSVAEEWHANNNKKSFQSAEITGEIATLSEVAPIVRGLCAERLGFDGGAFRRQILEFRATPEILEYVGGAELSRYGRAGPVTPDHAIHTKPWPVILPAPSPDALDDWREAAAVAFDAYAAEYRSYFERHNSGQAMPKTQLDPVPRVVLVPGLGFFGAGKSATTARIAADLTECTIEVISAAEAGGRFESIAEPDLFDVEYWSLEQAKLGKAVEKPLARHVVVVTGGAGGIGAATAQAFHAQGAEVAVLDRDASGAESVAGEMGGLGLGCDVTDTGAVTAAMDAICARFGGVDIVVSNAGAAWQGRIAEVSDADLRASFELNFFAHQNVARAAVKVMLAQDTGGVLLFNTSKQAVNPGEKFGPYGLPKAATLFLSRQYAVDYGAAGIRSNAVNADRIRSGLVTDDMIKARSKARGVSEENYMAGNLLHREVLAEDVAKAFVDLALSEKTTGAVLTVDGGNIAAALR